MNDNRQEQDDGDRTPLTLGVLVACLIGWGFIFGVAWLVWRVMQ
jgi:hypothetical protein